MSLDFTKIQIGRIRTKFTQSNALWTLDGDKLLEEGNTDADKYYVYKMARTQMDDYTSIIPYSTGNENGKFYGADNGNPLLVAFRSYLEDTGAGASYYEVVYDRVIVFHKK